MSANSDSEPFQNLMGFLANADNSTFRAYVFADLLIRSKSDLSNLLRTLFEGTWEYRIIELVLRSGPLNQSQMSKDLYGEAGKEYVFSRRSATKRALDRLVEKQILSQEKEGNGNYYTINPKMKPIIGILFMQ